MRSFLIILTLLVVLGFVGALYDIQIENKGDITPIENQFENKIVYTTDMDANKEKLKKDCDERGGEFNECGNICASDVEICSSVCAYTCKFEDEEKDVEIPKNWKTYESEKFNFSIKHPPEWKVEVKKDEIITAIRVLKDNEDIEDNFQRTGATHFTVYPEGLPTEGVFGNKMPAKISLTPKTERSEDYVLENGKVWASAYDFKNPPKSWEEYGFIWTGVEIKNLKTKCFDLENNELTKENCDPLAKNHKIRRRGEINEKDREIQEKILQTFKFTDEKAASKEDLIKVSNPEPNQEIESPILIKGEAKGSWYFEAQFNAELQDANRKTITSIPVNAKGDWMTDDFVEFETELVFQSPNTEEGFLILKKANPSGLPENSNSLEIPIVFK